MPTRAEAIEERLKTIEGKLDRCLALLEHEDEDGWDEPMPDPITTAKQTDVLFGDPPGTNEPLTVERAACGSVIDPTTGMCVKHQLTAEEEMAEAARQDVKGCPHNRQGVDDRGNLICLRDGCGYVFTQSGIVQNRLAPGGEHGRVLPDPNPPKWATEQSPGASPNNPGSPLVPHSS